MKSIYNTARKRSFRRWVKQVFSTIIRRQSHDYLKEIFEKLQDIEGTIEIIARQIARQIKSEK